MTTVPMGEHEPRDEPLFLSPSCCLFHSLHLFVSRPCHVLLAGDGCEGRLGLHLFIRCMKSEIEVRGLFQLTEIRMCVCMCTCVCVCVCE